MPEAYAWSILVSEPWNLYLADFIVHYFALVTRNMSITAFLSAMDSSTKLSCLGVAFRNPDTHGSPSLFITHQYHWWGKGEMEMGRGVKIGP